MSPFLLHVPDVVLATFCHIIHVGSLLLSRLIKQPDWPSCTPSLASTQTQSKQSVLPREGLLSPLHMCDRLLFFKVTNLISLIWLTFARAVLMATISCPHASVAAANRASVTVCFMFLPLRLNVKWAVKRSLCATQGHTNCFLEQYTEALKKTPVDEFGRLQSIFF